MPYNKAQRGILYIQYILLRIPWEFQTLLIMHPQIENKNKPAQQKYLRNSF